MNEDIKENGSTEVKNETNKFKPSWPKAMSWVCLILAVLSPVAAIGLSIVCFSSVQEDEKNEVYTVCGIALVIAVTLFASGLLSGNLLA